MTTINEFDAFFKALHGSEPFPWQSRLARLVHDKGWPKCIDLPTASGKTACLDIAVFVLACQANRPTQQRTTGRRIFFTVNRRVIVDEAHERAIKVAEALLNANDGILKRVADSLRDLNDDPDAPPLDVAELRGGIYRDRRWARSITQPIVVATTADQLGSRLLFRGYGVSSVMQPIHAALTACDSTILLDEAHVTRAFSQTLQAICFYRGKETAVPPMHFIEMTATPSVTSDEPFILNSEDFANKILDARQNASKTADLIPLGKIKPDKLVEAFVDRAIDALNAQRKAVGVIVNRVQTAREIHRKLLEKYPPNETGERQAEIHLMIGRMRPIDRDALQKTLRTLVGPDRPEIFPADAKPTFIVATQCLEVGADYDFDALITECAPIDALRQRFGRLNRKGRKNPDGPDGSPLEVYAAILATADSLKGDDPIYGDAVKNTWQWLTQGSRKAIDFGIATFKQLWDALKDDERKPLLSPALDAATLLPAHLDNLCQTAPQPVPTPDVAYFIHGEPQDDTDVQVCWRADMGVNSEDWPEIVSFLPPTSPECMNVPLRVFRKWLTSDRPLNADADVPILRLPQNEEDNAEQRPRRVLVWRGAEKSFSTDNPREVPPGATVVIPVAEGGWGELGHIPPTQSGISIDIGEKAIAESRRLRIIRIHPDLPNIAPELLEHAKSNEGTLSPNEIRKILGLFGRFKELSYPEINGTRPGIVLRFAKLIRVEKTLRHPTLEEEDDEETSSEIGTVVSLKTHTDDVVAKISEALAKLHLSKFTDVIHRAAELHDLGKADMRFQALLLGISPEEAMFRPVLLAKSANRDLSRSERTYQKLLAKYPDHFRHEMLSVAIVQQQRRHLINSSIDLDLLLHVIAAHHGHARPFAPLVIDNEPSDDLLEISIEGVSLSAADRRALTPAHRLDSGIAERFWKLTRTYGWWGLAYLESVLRLADQQASEMEQNMGEKDEQ